MDRDAIIAAVQEKHDPDMLKKVTPKAGKPFKPPAPPKVTANDVEKQIRSRSGANTPMSANSSVKQFTPSKAGMNRELMEIHKSQADAIERESDSARKAAET